MAIGTYGAGKIHAKQPTISETGQRVFRCEVRTIHDRQWVGLPLYLDADGSWVLPAGWRYDSPCNGWPGEFHRSRSSADEEGETEYLSLEKVVELGGLPW